MDSNDFDQFFSAYLRRIKEVIKRDGQYVFSPEDAVIGVKNSRCTRKIDEYYIVIQEVREVPRYKPLPVTLKAFKFFIQTLLKMKTDPNQKANPGFRNKYEQFTGTKAGQLAEIKLPVYKDFMIYVSKL